jgi:hypothetical protein
MSYIDDKKRYKQTVDLINANSSDWLEQIPAQLGDLDGVVAAGESVVYARLDNGQVIEAVNYIAPLIPDLHVLVGRSKAQRGFFQVIAVRETYPAPANGALKFHHEQHEMQPNGNPGPDLVLVDRKQIRQSSIWITDAAGFKISVYADYGQTPDGIKVIPTTPLDLSSYVPATGAKYISIESDSSGVVSVHDDPALYADSIALLTDANIPVPDIGKAHRGCVMLFESQTQLLNKHIRVASALGFISPTTGYDISSAPSDTPENDDKWGFWDDADEALKSVTHQDLFEFIIGDLTNILVSYNPGTFKLDFASFEPLTNGDPSDPQLVFDGDGDVIMTAP